MAISSHRTKKSIVLQKTESRPVKAVPPKEKFKSDLRRALNSNDNSYDHRFDVKFIIKDEPGKSIFAHKAILVQRCPYFRAMFTGGMKEKTEFEIEMSDFGFVALLAAIEYCYTDEVSFSEDTAVDLLVTASKLGMERLKTEVATYIAQGMDLDNLIEMYRLATIADSAPLCEYCSFFIIRTLSKLESSKEFTEVLTKEEIDSFTDRRQHWLEGVQVVDERVNTAIEQYWLAKLREGETVHTTNKKCIIM